MNLLFITALLLFSSISWAQIDTIKKYEYEICVYQNPKDKSRLLKNEMAGIADTTLAIIRGRVYDWQNKALPYSVISFENKQSGIKSGCLADSLGGFTIYLFSGNYNLTAQYVGYTDLSFDELQLKPGHIRQVEFVLGRSGCFRIYLIQSDKPLNKRKLKRTERRLKRKK